MAARIERAALVAWMPVSRGPPHCPILNQQAREIAECGTLKRDAKVECSMRAVGAGRAGEASGREENWATWDNVDKSRLEERCS
eukprot:6492151-Pyramimonas_sp.AAC.1